MENERIYEIDSDLLLYSNQEFGWEGMVRRYQYIGKYSMR